ncbi:MAG: sulfite exporter TauE/SafE family protein [Beijerinckiaceae bacterium]
MFDVFHIAMAFCGLAIAGLVKGAAGMGFSTTALPLLVLALGVEKAMPLVLIPSLSSNIFVMIECGEFNAMIRRFWLMLLFLIPGLIAGIWCLAVVDRRAAAAFLGAVLLTYGIYALSRPVFRLDEKLEKPLQIPVGIANGFVNGLTGSQVFPLPPFLLTLNLKPNQFTQTNNIAFTLSSLVMMAGLTKIGFMTKEIFLLSIAGIIPVWFSVKLGGAIRNRIDPETFRKMVLVVLMTLGAVLILRWLGA